MQLIYPMFVFHNNLCTRWPWNCFNMVNTIIWYFSCSIFNIL